MKKVKILFVLLVTGTFLAAHAQSPGYFSKSAVLTGTSAIHTSASLTLTPIDKSPVTLLRENNTSAKLNLKLDLGEDYVQTGGSFNVAVTLDIKNSSGSILSTQVITVDDHAPEMVKVVNLDISQLTCCSVSVLVSAITTTPNPLPTGLTKNYIDNNLRLTATLVREYTVDVRTAAPVLMSAAPAVVSAAINSRRVTFNWQPSGTNAYPDYELQIVKLENTDEGYKDNDIEIKTKVDWTKALKVETQSYLTHIDLTMAEGTGFYVWRVRPIGTYFQGGIANSENYGEWSDSGDNLNAVVFNKGILASVPNPTPYDFYFEDPDQDINWIYNRVFTEADNDPSAATGVKVSEGMNYADGLLRSRQTQTFNSSNNTNIVSQTISDYSGRPALSTLPVPVSGGLTGYKVGFVKNTAGDLYTAASYDKDLNVQAPSMVKDIGTEFSYYSNNTGSSVNNDFVPDAEGYPFKRTVFKADGTGRAEEESGVGKVHALGTLTNGATRTTRILFGSPSDDELIRIFGDEAPLSESVIKTTTIDANNVISVTYTSKEGKTIATALISENTDNLTGLKTAPETFTVTNTADQNVVSNHKFISSKRIAVTQSALDIALSYSITSTNSNSCASCDYQVRFFLVDLGNNITYRSDADNTTSGFDDFSTSNPPTKFPTANWEFRGTTSAGTVTINPDATLHTKITLQKGEYLFIKEVYSKNDRAYAEKTANDFNDKYQPVLDVISQKIIEAKSKKGSADLKDFMYYLNGLIAAYNSLPSVTNNNAILTYLGFMVNGVIPADGSTGVPQNYQFPLGFTMPYIPDDTPGSTTNSVTISFGNSTNCAKCPKDINVQVPKPDICFACDGNGSVAVTTVVTMTVVNTASLVITPPVEVPYGIEDIRNANDFPALSDADKRAAIAPIVQRYFIDLLADKLVEEDLDSDSKYYKIAPGFYRNPMDHKDMPGLKFMISNMLISKYYTGYSGLNTGNGVWYVASNAGVLTTTTVSTYTASVNFPFNYDCKQLLTAWTNAVNMLGSLEAEGGGNVLNKFNEEAKDQGETGEEKTDDQDNWEELSKRQQKKLKKKLGQELRDFNNSTEGQVPQSKIEALINLPNIFMNNAGYQFAAIIDGDPLPGYIPAASNNIPYDYTVSPSLRPSTSYSFTATSSAIAQANVPVLVDENGNPIYNSCNGNTSEVVFTYPYILKPEWMFKYFVYNVYNQTAFIEDNDYQVPNQVMTDLKWCYNKLNYYDNSFTTACNVSCTDQFLHPNWSSAERFNFYQQISGASKCWSDKGITNEPLNPVTCDPKSTLLADAYSVLSDQSNACADKATEIKTALIAELEASCYTIVACKPAVGALPNEITDKEINVMVQKVIDECKAEVKVLHDNLQNSVGPYNSGSTDNPEFTYPYCKETVCNEVNIEKGVGILFSQTSEKIEAFLFPQCDKNILDMLNNGSFLPDVPPLSGCPAHSKEWQAPNVFTPTTCPPGKVGAPSSPTAKYSSYSEVHSVAATPP